MAIRFFWVGMTATVVLAGCEDATPNHALRQDSVLSVEVIPFPPIPGPTVQQSLIEQAHRRERFSKKLDGAAIDAAFRGTTFRVARSTWEFRADGTFHLAEKNRAGASAGASTGVWEIRGDTLCYTGDAEGADETCSDVYSANGIYAFASPGSDLLDGWDLVPV